MSKTNHTTDDADLISYHAFRTGQAPQLCVDNLTRRVLAIVSQETLTAFHEDTYLQNYLAVKKSVWRSISALKESR